MAGPGSVPPSLDSLESLDCLAPYIVDVGVDGSRRSFVREAHPRGVLVQMAALGRALADHVPVAGTVALGDTSSTTLAGWSGIDTGHRLDRVLTRQLHADADRAELAFDRWLDRAAGAVRARPARLRLLLPARAERDRLRVVPGRLELRHSLLPVAVELELVAWGGWRTAVGLRPSEGRRPPGSRPPTGRYFAAAHAVMDVVMAALRSDVEAAR